MLEVVHVDIAVGKCGIGGVPIGKFDDLDVQACCLASRAASCKAPICGVVAVPTLSVWAATGPARHNNAAHCSYGTRDQAR